ncbi:MAG: hypothetical protein ACYDCL_13995 [Myxococcales bacterium]
MAPRGPRFAALLAVLSLAAARPALARSSPNQAALKRAIHLVARLEDERARVLLQKVLGRSPPAPIAAQCHLYLGIISLNALDTEGARAEFKKAIATDATVELPLSASPKARLVFGEAQGELAQASQLPAAPAPAPPPQPPSVLVLPANPPGATAAPGVGTALPQPKATSHAPAYVVGALGLAALGGGIALGLEASSTLAAAKANPVAAQAEAQGAQVGTFGLIADVCYGAALAAGVTAVVLFFTEKPHAQESAAAGPSAGIALLPGGALLTAGGQF